MSFYNIEIDIPFTDLHRLGIPSNITDKQLNDSGYTYKFRTYKDKILEKLIQEFSQKIRENIEFKISKKYLGVTLKGSIDI